MSFGSGEAPNLIPIHGLFFFFFFFLLTFHEFEVISALKILCRGLVLALTEPEAANTR